jgi:hypothetical protein
MVLRRLLMSEPIPPCMLAAYDPSTQLPNAWYVARAQRVTGNEKAPSTTSPVSTLTCCCTPCHGTLERLSHYPSRASVEQSRVLPGDLPHSSDLGADICIRGLPSALSLSDLSHRL